MNGATICDYGTPTECSRVNSLLFSFHVLDLPRNLNLCPPSQAICKPLVIQRGLQRSLTSIITCMTSKALGLHGPTDSGHPAHTPYSPKLTQLQQLHEIPSRDRS